MAPRRPAALLVADRGGVVELLRSGYERVPREGVAAIAPLLHPEFEVQTAPELPEAGTYRGFEQWQRLLETLGEPFEEIRLEPGPIVQISENLLIVPLRITGRGSLSDAPLDIEVTHVWTMSEGKALRLRVFTQPEHAMNAVMRDAYEAFNAGGFDSIGALLASTWSSTRNQIPDATVRHGPDGVAEYFAEGVERWETFELEVDDVVQVAEQVIVVTGVMRGRGSRSGASVESRFGHVYELENWRAKRMTFHFDPDRAGRRRGRGAGRPPHAFATGEDQTVESLRSVRLRSLPNPRLLESPIESLLERGPRRLASPRSWASSPSPICSSTCRSITATMSRAGGFRSSRSERRRRSRSPSVAAVFA